ARIGDLLFVGFPALGGFRCRARVFAMGVALLQVTRTLPGGLAGRCTLRLRDRGVIRIRAGGHRRRRYYETYQKSCCDNQGRPRAGFDRHIEISHWPPPNTEKDPAPCPQRGGKRESSGNTRQKLGNRVAADVRRMRACEIDVMSLPSAQPAVAIPG